jgi:hypothetical protein
MKVGARLHIPTADYADRMSAAGRLSLAHALRLPLTDSTAYLQNAGLFAKSLMLKALLANRQRRIANNNLSNKRRSPTLALGSAWAVSQSM